MTEQNMNHQNENEQDNKQGKSEQNNEPEKIADMFKKTAGGQSDLSVEQLQQRIADSLNQSAGNLDKDGYHCEKCKNRGYTESIIDGYTVHIECECLEIRKTLRLVKHSGLGNMAHCTFDNFKAREPWQAEMKRLAKGFLADEKAGCLYIGGQPGCGKTHLCSAVFLSYLHAGYDHQYMIWCDESKQLKAIINDPQYKDKIRRLKTVDVLYIDDFLKVRSGETPTSADINLAFEIINTRINSPGKITIISSEKTLDELKTFDEALMSRIFQACGEYKISISKDDQKNYRLKS